MTIGLVVHEKYCTLKRSNDLAWLEHRKLSRHSVQGSVTEVLYLKE